MQQKLLKIAIVVAALVATTPAKADWSTGNPVLDVIKAMISINNTAKRLENINVKKEAEDLAIAGVEQAGKNYQQKKAEDKFNQYKEKVLTNR